MSTQSFQPKWVSPPGDTMKDILQDREITIRDFADKMNDSIENIEDLLEGRMSITITTARQLEKVLGGSVAFWIKRDLHYREGMTQDDEINKNWLSSLPVTDMIKFGWINPKPKPSEELKSCLNFFKVNTVKEWYEIYDNYQLANFRTSQNIDSRPASVISWIRQGEIVAETIDCNPWNPEGFRNSLQYIRTLTRIKHPRQFIKELQRCCAENGVAVVIVRAPSGCTASGVTKFINDNKALLLLSFRFRTDDHFWFTFFHESGHLLLHQQETINIEQNENFPKSNDIGLYQTQFFDTPIKEDEANAFANQILIPNEFEPDLFSLQPTTRNIIRLAMSIGISPGIVVGRLQHLKRLEYSQMNHLKRRFSWTDL